MEKILFVTDAQQLSNRAMDFAGFICQLSRSGLTGVFLQSGAANGFKKACEARSIKGLLHPDAGITREGVVAESRFADLVLLPADGEMLQDAGCPVIVMPAKFEGLDQLIFIYDGEPASIHAIKQFTYLLPDLKDLPLQLICLKEDDDQLMEEEEQLMTYLDNHYRDVLFTQHTGEGLSAYLAGKERSFIVMNAEAPKQKAANQALFILQ